MTLSQGVKGIESTSYSQKFLLSLGAELQAFDEFETGKFCTKITQFPTGQNVQNLLN